MMTPSISPGWPDANLGPGDVQGPRYDFVLEPCGQHSRSIGRGASSSVPQGGQSAPPGQISGRWSPPDGHKTLQSDLPKWVDPPAESADNSR